ncbi:hypothetical protein [Nannocystis punicea]|uniref:Uncharacterized protein n=1 Tax=Nannocystis punicea TaxID=2995304 RepID=A0ABY7HE28_9BACT|nr:hypothetical protein [Nannocystis poenicansa]WAS97522.1 hypothetical protein O0S08_15360 [Nannocystis poenicansa]
MTRRRATALACAAALTSGQVEAANPATEALRRDHEGCQALRKDGRSGEAGSCFERVYVGLTELDPRASRDLFNVLSDTVAAYEQAHASDGETGSMCRAAGVVRDYLERPQKAEAIRLRRRALGLADRIDQSLRAASQAAGRDVCADPPPPTPTPEVEKSPTGDAAPAGPTTPAPALKRLPPPRPSQWRGQTSWAAPSEPSLELLAAGFGVSIGGALTSAVGVGLLLYRAECTTATPDCSDAALASYHDAGYLTLAAGAGILVAGASLLFADRVQERKRRAARAAPTFGAGGAGIAAFGRF